MTQNQQQYLEYGSAEEYLGIVRRIAVKRWWLIALFAVAAGVAGLAGSMLVEPVYRASTTIRIQKNVLASPTRRGPAGYGTGVLETEAVWLKNRLLLEEVVDKTGIGAMAGSKKERVALTDKLRDSIIVTALIDSLQVSVDWSDPELAANIANTLAASFIERYGALNREEARELRALLEQQASFVRIKVDEARRQLSAFVEKHGDITVSQQALDANERLAALQTDLARNKIALDDAAKRLELVEKRMGKDGKGLSELEFAVTPEQIANSTSIQASRARIAELEQEVATLSSLYTDEFPDLKKAKAQLHHARQALAEEFARLIPGLEISVDDAVQTGLIAEFVGVRSEIEQLQSQQNGLSALVAQLEERTKELPDREGQYFTLLNNVNINQDIFNTLMARLMESTIAEQTDTWDVRVLERAYTPYNRLRPKPVNNAVFGVIIGLLLGVAVCMLLEYLDDSFKTAEEVERLLQLPVLAVLPKFDLPALEYGPKKYH